MVMMVLAILFAELSYRFYEKNAFRWLKKVLFKPKPAKTISVAPSD